jgi:hypothetical protein
LGGQINDLAYPGGTRRVSRKIKLRWKLTNPRAVIVAAIVKILSRLSKRPAAMLRPIDIVMRSKAKNINIF